MQIRTDDLYIFKDIPDNQESYVNIKIMVIQAICEIFSTHSIMPWTDTKFRKNAKNSSRPAYKNQFVKIVDV